MNHPRRAIRAYAPRWGVDPDILEAAMRKYTNTELTMLLDQAIYQHGRGHDCGTPIARECAGYQVGVELVDNYDPALPDAQRKRPPRRPRSPRVDLQRARQLKTAPTKPKPGMVPVHQLKPRDIIADPDNLHGQLIVLKMPEPSEVPNHRQLTVSSSEGHARRTVPDDRVVNVVGWYGGRLPTNRRRTR